MREVDGSIRWATKVPASLIRRLYQQDAAGILDVALVEEVAYALWDRCRDIQVATRAQEEAPCGRCDRLIVHAGRKDTILRCDCGWVFPWVRYHRSIKGHRLHGGTAFPFFVDYVANFDQARSVSERMVLIDRLLNQWHTWARSIHRRDGPTMLFAGERDGDVERFPVAPAAANLIESRDPVAFLDELSGITSRVRVPSRRS